jgi:hypothetical protein
VFDSKLCGIVIRQTARENRNSLAVSCFIHVSLSFGAGQSACPIVCGYDKRREAEVLSLTCVEEDESLHPAQGSLRMPGVQEEDGEDTQGYAGAPHYTL